MATVRNILQKKGSQVWYTRPEAPVIEALHLMAEKDIGALVVMDGETIAGIFSERDYARKVVLKGKTSRNTPVREIMSAPVVSVHHQQSVAECMAIMARGRFRHLPVTEGGKLVGIISIGDVVSTIMAEQEEALQRLERAALGGEELLAD